MKIKKLEKVRPIVKDIFCLGEWKEDLFDKCVAVVGSRRMTSYGERVIEKIVPVLVEAGVTIVSGFMYGVDQKAHEVCVETGGKTIAVLGWGIDCPPKRREENLYKKIIETGLVISEYPEKTSSRLWMFPYRNRIVAGLSEAVLVIEAAEGSGSLITAKMALEQGKILLAVPGPITSKVSDGTAALIKSGKATMVSSGEEILKICGWHVRTVPTLVEREKIGDVRTVLTCLGDEAMMVDEIARKLKRPVQEIMKELSLLELKGEVMEKEGKYYLQ